MLLSPRAIVASIVIDRTMRSQDQNSLTREVPRALVMRDSGAPHRCVRIHDAAPADPLASAGAAAYEASLRRERRAAWDAALAALTPADRDAALSALLTRAARIDSAREGRDPSAIPPVRASEATDETIERALAYVQRYDGASATADLVTRAVKASGYAARYADRPDVTGAIPAPRMAVRGSRSVGPTDRGPAPSVCTLAHAHRQALTRAELDARARVIAIRKAKNSAARKAAISHARAHLRAWANEPSVLAAAVAVGWRA